jgi:1,2-beta-oligoglucan phosphorylase
MKLTNPLGLAFELSDSGVVQSIVVDPIRIGLRPATPFSRTGTNLYLRQRSGGQISYAPLLGPDSPSRFHGAEARGSWQGLEYSVVLQLAQSQLAWQWRVQIESKLDREVEVDVIYVQDVGLQANGTGPVNEHYVSQYLERRVFEDARYGAVVACRQNMKTSVGHPWLLLACVGRASAASTDGVQFYGKTFRATAEPEALRAAALGGELADEASVVALQQQPFVLGQGKSVTCAFVASYVPDHPDASSEQDLIRVPELVRGFSAPPPSAASTLSAPVRRRFQTAPLLQSEDLSEAELEELFGSAWRHVEKAEDGQLLSFFREGPEHVVLRAKEQRVDRPHGHILQAQLGYVPDDRIVSTTAFACGVFHSHLTQGNTNFNTLLSVCTNPATPALEGQRIFVQLDGVEHLLGVPSAFAMGLNDCTWIYKHGPLLLRVHTWTAPREPRANLQLEVLRGPALRLAISHQLDAASGWTVKRSDSQFVLKPRTDSMLAGQYPSAQFRLLAGAEVRELHDAATPLFVLEVPETKAFSISFVAEVTGPAQVELAASRRADLEGSANAWRELSRGLTLSGSSDIAAIDEALPWFGMNALIHYLTPYGLEQFSGAAWGTRDVSQGPIELLLAQEKYAEAKQVLCSIFSHQNPDGGWPQWWMFDRYASVRAHEAHGDIIYWTILALCSYIKASGDSQILDEPLPYYQTPQPARLSEHIDKIVDLVISSFVPGTALVQFGGGDWNDSLQPVSKELAERLISSWTVQMSYQAFSEYREVCERAGRKDKAQRMAGLARDILADFQRHLMKDGIVAGYGLVNPDQPDKSKIAVLLHPSDTQTGIHYSLLPMNRGVISGVFDKQQAERHQQLIAEHLTGPDGARLMDKPLPYRGGPQTIFQRAESSTYFGREIGLMYVHEHLRYAESQARLGKPETFVKALRQAIPVDYRSVVPQGDLRQANCYYSSSDVAFESRYQADALYADVIAGKTQLKGGWRVYSSGPGIYVALIVTRLLGLRIEREHLIVDPVMPRSLNGTKASLQLRGRPVTFEYRVSHRGFGPSTITVDGKAVRFDREKNPYREGGAIIRLDTVSSHVLVEI